MEQANKLKEYLSKVLKDFERVYSNQEITIDKDGESFILNVGHDFLVWIELCKYEAVGIINRISTRYEYTVYRLQDIPARGFDPPDVVELELGTVFYERDVAKLIINEIVENHLNCLPSGDYDF